MAPPRPFDTVPAPADTDLRRLLDASPDAVLIVDSDGVIREVNAEAMRLFHGSRRKLLGHPVESLIPSHLRPAHRAFRQAFAAAPMVRPMSTRGRLVALRVDGVEVPVEISLVPLLGERRGMVMAVVRDVTARARMEEALYAEKERAQVTLASIADGVIATDAAGRVEYLNAAAEALSGWSAEAARGRKLGDVLQLRDEVTDQPHEVPCARCLMRGGAVARHRAVALLARPEGHRLPVEYTAAPLCNRAGDVVGSVVVFRDVTLHRQLTDRLSYQATHDALTGLVNRPEFERRLARVLVSAKQKQMPAALGYIDLDGFKSVNDTFGHSAGDALLRQLSRALSARIRRRDTLGRLGGDEFGLLLEHCPPKRAYRLVAALQRAVADFVFEWNGRTLRVGASVGLVELNPASASIADVLGEADAACYDAKRRRQLKLSRRGWDPTRHPGSWS